MVVLSFVFHFTHRTVTFNNFQLRNKNDFLNLFLCQNCQIKLSYLLDVYIFSKEDIELNSLVLTWPERILSSFNEEVNINDQLGHLELSK